jgi:copper resistance protein C
MATRTPFSTMRARRSGVPCRTLPRWWFTQQLEPAFTTAAVTDKSGNRVDQGDARVDPKDPTELRVSLKPLPPGTYTVAWHALSVDTHTTEGHFTFEVGGG